ncbi:hypothetical protein [Nocardia yunnanensis]|uniref:hypothetical protein n=1 Tax=Nocardia yunnanensis TaxID=2382165 RepID=UPI0013C4CBE7|nr:hypothetical protein [Nocardia yunnanensis]
MDSNKPDQTEGNASELIVAPEVGSADPDPTELIDVGASPDADQLVTEVIPLPKADSFRSGESSEGGGGENASECLSGI